MVDPSRTLLCDALSADQQGRYIPPHMRDPDEGSGGGYRGEYFGPLGQYQDWSDVLISTQSWQLHPVIFDDGYGSESQ